MRRITECRSNECKDRFDVIQKKTELSIEIEKGMLDGEQIVVFGEGDATTENRAGDLIFIIQAEKHKTFERVNRDDLKVDLKISLKEALVGFERQITHLDGRVVTIRHNDGRVIKPGDIMKMPGEGMPVRGNVEKKGDLFLQFDVQFPETLSKEQHEKLKTALP